MTAAPPPSGLSAALDRPLYGATFGQALGRYWRKYATFSGRASRSEFWWWFLFYAGIGTVLSIIGQVVAGAAPTGPAVTPSAVIGHSVQASLASSIWALINFVGGIAITVRRLHDTNRRGWWWFIQLIPVVGAIVMIVFMALPTDPAGSRFDR